MDKVKSDHMVANWRMGRERETAGEDSLCRKQKNMYGRNGGTNGKSRKHSYELTLRLADAERIEIEDFVQNIVERMETPEAFEKMISREEECEAQGQESRLRDVLKKEWPVDEKGERIYQITNIYEEKAEELLIVELYTGIHLENGVPCGHFTLYLCGEPDGWKLSETRMMEYLQNL